MEIFEEVKNRYFHIIFKVLSECKGGLKERDILGIVDEEEFSEKIIGKEQQTFSGLLVNNYEDQENYNLLKKEGDIYYPSLENEHNSSLPVRFTNLEKEWLKALIKEPEIKLILRQSTIEKLQKALKTVDTPMDKEIIENTNTAILKDLENMEQYENNFKFLLQAIIENKAIRYCNTDRYGNNYCDVLSLPLRLEYSLRDGRFRVSMHSLNENRPIMATISTMSNIEILKDENLEITREGAIKGIRQQRYSSEPVILEVYDKKMAMERCFMSFSGMERSSRCLEDNKYEIRLNYYVFEEEEVIRKILALGPYVKVISPERIINEVVKRVNRALEFIHD